MLLTVNRDHPEPRKIARAAEILKKGGVVAYPTDAVYGLGVDIESKSAFDKLYQMRGLDRAKSLALVCPDLSDISRYAIVENPTYRVLKRYLPGPYVFILKATREVPKILLSKQKTVGIRVPNHPVTQALVRELGRPILNTTAADGQDTLVDPWAIQEAFPGVDLVLDAETGSTIPTTIIDLSGDDLVVVREGCGPILDE